MTNIRPLNPAGRERTAEELVALLHALGLAAVVRDPHSAQVLAASPSAETAILKSKPSLVNVVSTQVGGHEIRVEALRTRDEAAWELTPRQQQVAGALVEGLSNEAIGHRYGISPHTVRRHVEEILRRLGVPNRKEAATELRRRQLAGTLAERPPDGSATARD